MAASPSFIQGTVPTGRAAGNIISPGALLLLDLLTGAEVAGQSSASPPASPQAGLFYLVAASPTGAWSGHAGELAAMTSGGWRFVAPFDGLRLTEAGGGAEWLRTGGAWRVGVIEGSELRIAGQKVIGNRGAAIAAPSGGTTIDSEARTCLGAILSILRAHGLIEL